jgi:hypothetical protein
MHYAERLMNLQFHILDVTVISYCFWNKHIGLLEKLLSY